MTDHRKLLDANGRLKTRFAAVLRRIPALMNAAQFMWRLRMPRFTGGVIGVVVSDAGEVLLLQHVFHIEHPWGLPGGWLNRREDPEAALIRELAEEIGLPIAIERHLLTVADPRHAHLDFAYLCQPLGEVSHLSAEIIDYAWCALPDLPPLVPFHQRAVEAAFPEAMARRTR